MPARLRQIVINLVGNAIKFTDAGEVVLEVACQSVSDSRATLEFAVTDTGIGIPKGKCESIFHKFEQADSSTTRRFGGTGLGLAICVRLVELMGGRMWVESEVGQGSTFHFTATFPVAVDSESGPMTTAIIGGLPVLIVDDNATNRRVLQDMVRSWGMLPVVVSSAQDAIQKLREAPAEGPPIRLVLSDVNMPEVDGFRLAEWIRKDGELSQTDLIMLTSGEREGDSRRRERLAVAAHLMKPVKQSELYDAIVRCPGLAAQGEAPGTAASRSTSLPRTRPLRILLAEDNLVNQKLAIGVLKKLGHEVAVASTGREAVSHCQTNEFDVVLMDVQMPEMDGLEASKILRAEESGTNRRIPIIAVTAHAMKGDRERCLEMGMDDYISKPIRIKEIAAKLAAIFGETAPEETKKSVSTRDEGMIDWSAALETVGDDRKLLHEVVEASARRFATLNDRRARCRPQCQRQRPNDGRACPQGRSTCVCGQATLRVRLAVGANECQRRS